MLNVLKRELRANLKSVLIWSAVMLVMAVMGFGEYSIVMGGGSNTDLGAVVDMMPRIVKVMFGMGAISINTPEGWYICMYLWCAMIAYLHAAMLGAGIISKEESDKTSEFLFTKPIKRAAVITGKLFAAAINTFVVVIVGWAGTMAVFAPSVRDTGLVPYITLTMTGMLITSFVFLLIGLCLSAVASGRGRAAQLSAIVIIMTYFISVAIEMVNIDYLDFLSPFRYFDAAKVLDGGLQPLYLLISAGLAVIMGYFTYTLYSRRNLHS